MIHKWHGDLFPKSWKKKANNVLFLSCFHMGELPQGNKGMIEWSQCKKDVCSPFLNFNSRKILAFLSMVL